MNYEYEAWHREDRDSFLEERNRYWSAVHAMRPEYTAEYKHLQDPTARPTLNYWAEEKYGFKMETDGTGNYTANYTVVDSKKFMLFQIKYWR